MLIVPDANAIISALIKRGKALELFEWNDFNRELTFAAPENLSSEIRRNLPEIINKSRFSESEFLEILNKIESQIEFIPLSKFKSFIPSALKISPPNDFPYIALALFFKSRDLSAKVLSNDNKIGMKRLKLEEAN